MCDEEAPAIVVDMGSGMCKAGFGGDDAPRSVFPTVVGFCVGDEVRSRSRVLALKYPIQRGAVTNSDDATKIWQHIYEKLNVAPEDHGILQAMAPLSSDADKEKMAQIMFEHFQAPRMKLINQDALCLFASGRLSGVVLNSGEGISFVSTIYETSVCNTVSRNDLAGHDLTNYLSTILEESGHFTEKAEPEIVRDIKEKLCFIAGDSEQMLATYSESKNYALPDGRVIAIGDERFRCPNALFEPQLLGITGFGIHEMLYNSISKCDEQIRELLCRNIVLSGGTTMLPGFAARLKKELTSLAPTMRVRIIAPPDRKYSIWLGGSILASLTSFQQCCISRQEYEEFGSSILKQSHY